MLGLLLSKMPAIAIYNLYFSFLLYVKIAACFYLLELDNFGCSGALFKIVASVKKREL